MSTTRLPVLFLTDLVVLPGMVVPIELDDAARAVVDTAKAHSDVEKPNRIFTTPVAISPMPMK